MKPVVWLPPVGCAATATAIARTLAAPEAGAVAGVVLVGAGVAAAQEPAGLGSLTAIELPGGELPDFHALGLLLASAIDSMRADVVVSPRCAGSPAFEAVAAAVAAQLDWPIAHAARVSRDRDDLVIELRRGGRLQRRRVAPPIVLVVPDGVTAADANGRAAARTVLTASQLQVPRARLRPASEAIGAIVPGGRARTASASSARALVTRLLTAR
jgi:electron transfer flavoprotein alpha/beta subunit